MTSRDYLTGRLALAAGATSGPWWSYLSEAGTVLAETREGGMDEGPTLAYSEGYDADTFAFCVPPDAALRQQLGLEGALVLGFVGSFYAYEGLDHLLQAAQHMRVRHPNLRVLLVGGGPQEEALKAQAQALGLQDCVLFAGRIDQSQVQRYYGLIDMLAYPRLPMRLTDRVTPLKPLEAMAQGNLFVASDVGGHRELVRHGETGMLFAAGNVLALEHALESLLSIRDRWPHLRRRARQFVEQERSWTASVARYRAVYQRALQGRDSESLIV